MRQHLFMISCCILFSPLDELIDKLGGTKCVAEMTGRRGRIVRNSPEDKPHFELRALDVDSYGRMESLNVHEASREKYC